MPAGNIWEGRPTQTTGQVTGNNMEQTDKDLKENKDYIHRHISEGIRTMWSEEGKEQEKNGNNEKKLGGKKTCRRN